MTVRPSEEKAWLRRYDRSILEQPMLERTIYETMHEACLKLNDHWAVYYFGTRLNYKQLLQHIDDLADAFYGLGVRAGDIVTILMPTMPESIYTLYALNKIGAISNFMDPRMSANRIVDAVRSTHSNVLVTLDIAVEKTRKSYDELGLKKVVVLSAGNSLKQPLKTLLKLKQRVPAIKYDDQVITWKDFMTYGEGVHAELVPWKENSVACITYTGGTTGSPKGVMLTNDGMNTMADSFDRCGADREPGERFLGIMPIFSSYGVGCGVHLPLIQGAEDVLIPQFSPEELGKLIAKHKTGHMMAVPSFYESIMRSPALVGKDLSFIKTTGCGGDTMNSELEEQFNKFLADHGCKYPVCQGYGMSEMTGAATCCFNDVYKDGSVGIPLIATTVGVFDPATGEEVGYNVEGEICMRGRNMMLGYYDKEEETKNVMRVHKDGLTWVHSGDIGYIDEDGFVYIKGRIKHMVTRFDGHKVFPLMIETVVMQHEAVATVAVVGVPDRDHAQGYVPLIIIELKPEYTRIADKERLKKEMLDMCLEQCEKRGQPGDVVFIDEMMYTALCKHDYKALTERYKDYVIHGYE